MSYGTATKPGASSGAQTVITLANSPLESVIYDVAICGGHAGDFAGFFLFFLNGAGE